MIVQVLYRRWHFSPRQMTRADLPPLVSAQSHHLPDAGNGFFPYTIANTTNWGGPQISAVVCYAMPELSPHLFSSLRFRLLWRVCLKQKDRKSTFCRERVLF